MEGVVATDCFDTCQEAVEEFGQAAGSFSDTLGDWVDDTSGTTFGDVISTGVEASSEWVQMDTICDAADAGDTGE